ncbi:hypothetical protein [Moorena sp. SIO4A5]|uniref:hypothetical protein n=1 Tax=Moorena sp. SIO4A5 TaxID=2607838 RepID=UPI0013C85FF5|nr:hypothetical protein [Moorena sp. SIO4A5]NEO23443.1 hypothetical protein [Moorena sp. SIO4A5]
MSTIKIAELRPAGSELFQDSESFLNELSDGQEMDMVLGGRGKRGGNVITSVISNVNTQVNITNINSITGIFGGGRRRRRRRRRKH